ncbi:MAG: hypothetical protein AB1656_12705 [Candidatus Omnitrophota bacterium]
MDSSTLERIITEEVNKILAERRRGDDALLPPDQNATLDSFACRGPSCSAPAASLAPMKKATPLPIDGPAILVLFTGAREKWDVLTAAFRIWREAGMRLDAIFSDSAKYVIPIAEVEALGFRMIDQPAELSEIIYDMKRYVSVFIPSISRTHAAKLALGITDNVTLNLMLASLAQNVPTVASDDGLGATACLVCGNQVPGIQEILSKYREQLAVMGLKLRPAEEAVKEIGRIAINKAESGPDLITALVTEEDAIKLKGPVVKVARGGLITPLAMEYLTKQGIEIVIVPQR